MTFLNFVTKILAQNYQYPIKRMNFISNVITKTDFGCHKKKYSVNEPSDKKKEQQIQNPEDLEEPHEKRETWSGKFDFFLSALGYAVGLGAVWRFPYLCYKNGGGVFLIPYFVFLFLVGIPLVFMELCVGQFTSNGPLTCWVMCPIFRGLGISMNIVNSYVNIYYNMIIAYSLYFLVLSLRSVLPWEKCNPKWSSPNCVDDYRNNFTYTACDPTNGTIKCDNGRCYSNLSITGLNATCNTSSELLQDLGWYDPIYPSQDYWNNVILRKTDGIDNTGVLVWQLAVALLVAWIIVFAMVIKGIQVSGKIVYFTSLFPYVVLLILGIRGWLLDGAEIGIKFYIYPDLSKLKDINVWSDAAVQVFFTLSVAYGGLIALSSYNKFHTNVMRDAILVSLSNCLTSVFAGFVVFAYIGYLSKQTGLSIDKVVQAGQGLAYVVYPYAVTTIPAAPFWSILFFVMMLLLGLDTMMSSVEIAITSIFDLIPNCKKTKFRKYMVIFAICAVMYLCGLIFCAQSGTYWVELFDNYSGSYAVLLVGALEAISIMWFYGYDNFKRDISVMLGKKVTDSKFFIIWRILWTVVCPVYLIVLVIFTIKNTTRLESGGYVYPYWTDIVGNIISASTMFGAVIWPIYLIIDALFINKRPLKTLFTPAEKWRPLKKVHQALVKQAYEEDKLKREEKKRLKKEKKQQNKVATNEGNVNESFQTEMKV